ncbi:metallophosphoesterase [uncultured Enterococcus sp.]|uniref:metallophosphoesterase n=1 Tax=uncultured Enterococcus sp. TaxID=167972 RepID=UPI002AA7FA01|nr:metallophosphoesterase [uncultured Enterococcus sp.]
MKKRIAVLVCGIALLLIVIFSVVHFKSDGTKRELKAAETLLQKEEMDFWIITDTHYIDESLYDEGKAFEYIKTTAAGKDLTYQKESLQALTAQLLKEKPDGLIVTGDITLNGEFVSAEQFVKLLAPVKDAGIEIFVIPGNHDIHDGWARKFSGDTQEKTPQISAEEFKEMFSEYGYEQSVSQDEKSLSYLISMNKQYNFLFLDSNIYTLEPSTRNPTTAGRIDETTKKWVKEQLEFGAEKGKKTFVFMHHNLFSHNKLVNKGFVLNNAEEMLALFKEYEVPVCFSGHIHAQDILTDKDSGITEIVTASYAITPNPVGVLQVNNQKLKYTRQEIDVDQWARENHQSKDELLNHSDYLEELFLKESRSLGYRYLLEAGYTKEESLDLAAELVGELNLRFFTGEDFISDAEVKEIKESNAYQIISEESPELTEYIDSIIQDKNENDILFEKSLK